MLNKWIRINIKILFIYYRSNYARIYVRHLNELDHEFTARSVFFIYFTSMWHKELLPSGIFHPFYFPSPTKNDFLAYLFCKGHVRYCYYTSLSFFLYKNMTVVLLVHPKINCMTIPPVVPVKNIRTIPLCGNFSNHISRTFLNHSSHWFKLNDVMQVLWLSLRELMYWDGRQQVNNDYSPLW